MTSKITKIIFIAIFCAFSYASNAQVLISLLFGKQLNTENVEFGLVGGLNQSSLKDIEGSEASKNFNLGFYFHVLMKENSYLSTGLQVKSTVGAAGMDTYPIGNVEFDDIYKDGELTKKLNYIYLPIMYQHRFKQHFYIEGGAQVGVNYKATDEFYEEGLGGDLTYSTDVSDQIKRFDAGLTGGVGVKFRKVPKSMSVGVNYYYGLVDVSKVADVKMVNSSVLIFVKIPIGVHKECK